MPSRPWLCLVLVVFVAGPCRAPAESLAPAAVLAGRNPHYISYAHGPLMSFSPDGKLLAVAAGDALRLWDVESGEILREFSQFTSRAGSMERCQSTAFSPDGKTVAVVHDEVTDQVACARRVSVWEVATGKDVLTLRSQNREISHLVYSSDGKSLITATGPRERFAPFDIQVWDTASRKVGRTLKGPGQLEQLFVSPDGKELVARSEYEVKRWDLASGKERVFNPGGVFALATFLGDGSLKVFHRGWAGTTRIWDVTTGKHTPFRVDGEQSSDLNILALSRDGKFAVTYGLLLLNLELGIRRIALNWERGISVEPTAAFSPDGKILAVLGGQESGDVGLFDLSAVTFRGRVDTMKAVSSLAFSPDGKRLAIANRSQLRLMKFVPDQEWGRIESHADEVGELSFSADSRRLAAVCRTGKQSVVRVWDAAAGLGIKTIGVAGIEKGEETRSLAYSRKGMLAVGLENGAVFLRDTISTEYSIGYAKVHTGKVTSLAFTSDGKRLISGGLDGTVRCSRLGTRQPPAFSLLNLTLTEEWVSRRDGKILAVTLSPDGKILATGGTGPLVQILDPETGAVKKTLEGHGEAVGALAFSRDRNTLAVVCSVRDGGKLVGEVHLWDVETWQRRPVTLKSPESALTTVAFSRDGTHLFTGGQDGRLVERDVVTGKPVERPLAVTPKRTPILGLDVSPDGRHVVAGGAGWYAVWDVATGLRCATWDGNEYYTGPVRFSPDGRILAQGVGSMVFTVPVARHVPRLLLRQEGSDLHTVAFSPDVKGEVPVLATGGSDKAVTLWDANTGKKIGRLEGHEDTVLCLTFNHDGTLLFTGSGDKTVKIWDVAKREVLATLPGHAGAVGTVAVSRDGKTLVARTVAGEMRVWDLESRRTRFTRTEVVGVSLTPGGHFVVITSEKEGARLVDAKTGKFVRDLGPGFGTNGRSPQAISPDGRYLAIGWNAVDPGWGYYDFVDRSARGLRLWDLAELLRDRK